MTETVGGQIPVVPQDAASVVLYKEGGNGLSILMGRRPPKSRFIPDAFVFPGGKVDPEDWQVEPTQPLEPQVEAALRATTKCTKAKARALANAAIRETFEETGLMLAERSRRTPSAVPGSWQTFEDQGLAPNHQVFRCIARAITPPNSPIRFHARFLTASAEATTGTLRATTELLDLAWYPLVEALKLPIIDVTEAVLEEVATLANQSKLGTATAQGPTLFMSYRDNRLLKRRREASRSL